MDTVALSAVMAVIRSRPAILSFDTVGASVLILNVLTLLALAGVDASRRTIIVAESGGTGSGCGQTTGWTVVTGSAGGASRLCGIGLEGSWGAFFGLGGTSLAIMTNCASQLITSRRAKTGTVVSFLAVVDTC